MQGRALVRGVGVTVWWGKLVNWMHLSQIYASMK